MHMLIHIHQIWQHKLLYQLRRLFVEALIVTEAIFDVRESHNCPRTFETHFTMSQVWLKEFEVHTYFFESEFILCHWNIWTVWSSFFTCDMLHWPNQPKARLKRANLVNPPDSVNAPAPIGKLTWLSGPSAGLLFTLRWSPGYWS